MGKSLYYALTVAMVLLLASQQRTVVDARHSNGEKEAKKEHSLKSKSKMYQKQSKTKEGVVQPSKHAKRTGIVQGDMPAALDLETKEEAKKAAISELKSQPKLVALVDGVSMEDGTPLYSSYPTPTPGDASAMPTILENCDPASPPCKKFTNGGACAIYYNCEHFQQENRAKAKRAAKNSGLFGAEDDDNGTDEFSPTKMPLPHPTPSPTENPTSVPTSSAPTYTGYTPMPTISMAPTVEETAGPTSKGLCNPEDPPCDHWFNGTCLGVVHCKGSHPPTPAPSHNPDGNDPPTAKPTGPTLKPTIGPTDFAEELDEEIYAEGQKEKKEGEAMRAARLAAAKDKRAKAHTYHTSTKQSKK